MSKKPDTPTATIRAADDGGDGKVRFIIGGRLGFDTVPDLIRQANRLFTAADEVIVDFSEVTGCNSAALAVILEIAKSMREKNKAVCFRSLPEEIRTFARAYSVEKELSEAGLLC